MFGFSFSETKITPLPLLSKRKEHRFCSELFAFPGVHFYIKMECGEALQKSNLVLLLLGNKIDK
ncbi:hypothetical protein HQ29_03725 [Porphyromonas canoris]|nr:hypothetical protein HQ29_03725 [Porphyromonas canoris]